LQQHGDGGDRQDDCKGASDRVLDHSWSVPRHPEPEDNSRRAGNAAQGETADDAPIDTTAVAKGGRRGELGGRREDEVRSDGDGGRLAKDQHEDRGHERAAAHPC
jgi:hypothetical protein